MKAKFRQGEEVCFRATFELRSGSAEEVDISGDIVVVKDFHPDGFHYNISVDVGHYLFGKKKGSVGRSIISVPEASIIGPVVKSYVHNKGGSYGSKEKRKGG